MRAQYPFAGTQKFPRPRSPLPENIQDAMQNVGATPREVRSYNTCWHGQRVLHFSQIGGRLVVSEVALNQDAGCPEVETAFDCKASSDAYIACCPLSDKVLVMAGNGTEVFAALVNVDEGELTALTLHVVKITVAGSEGWPNCPFLCPVSETRALLSFFGQPDLWHCDLKGTTLQLTKLLAKIPWSHGFCTLPITLQDGSLLVAGANPSSTAITRIVVDGQAWFETIGNIPGDSRWGVSLVALGDRFVIGFGGNSNSLLDTLWILDLQSRGVSTLAKGNAWHPAGSYAVLLTRDDTLYILGGQAQTRISSLPYKVIPSLIQNTEIKAQFQDFLENLHLPRKPSPTGVLSVISALWEELEESRREAARLRTKLRQATPPPGTALVYLPFVALPCLSLPRGNSRSVMADASGARTQSACLPMEIRGGLTVKPQIAPLRGDCPKSLRPLLCQAFLRRLSLALRTVPHQVSANAYLSQASVALFPGCCFPDNCRLSRLARFEPCRPWEKLMNSCETRLALWATAHALPMSEGSLALAPPAYGALLSAANSFDPLIEELSHKARGRIRRVLQGARVVASLEGEENLQELITRLKKIWDLSKRGCAGERESV